MQKTKEYYTIKKGNFSNCMHFGHAGGCRFEYSRVFSVFQAGRGDILGISSIPEVSHGGDGRPSAAATCVSAEASLGRRYARIHITLLLGCEHIAAGGPGGQGGEALPCKTQLVPAARSHTPSSAINQVAGISLISYRGEQPEKASTAGQENLDTVPLHVAAGLQRGGPSAVPTSVSFLFIILSPAKCTRIRSSLWKFVVFLMTEQTSHNDFAEPG